MQYVWLIWSLLLLAIWAIVYSSLKNKESKKEMLAVSLWTSLLGLTEPPTWYCRPDLKKKMFASAFIFLGLYFVYFLTLEFMYPGYVESVWNLAAISGILVIGIPLEELMFAFGLGFFWSSVYEHIKWRKMRSM